MDSVKVSTKYQVVIPKSIRQSLKIQPGQKMQVIAYGNNIVMIPIRSINEARGSFPGIDTDPQREKEDRQL